VDAMKKSFKVAISFQTLQDNGGRMILAIHKEKHWKNYNCLEMKWMPSAESKS
jgi:hypothetical protein